MQIHHTATLYSLSSTPCSPTPPQHADDVIEVRSLRLADSGSFVDQDDEVADVLEDNEMVRWGKSGMVGMVTVRIHSVPPMLCS